MEIFFRFSKIALPLAIVAVCLFGHVLHSHSGIFRELQAAVLSVEWMLLACFVVWCGTFIYLTFSRTDWPLIGLLLIGIAAYFIGYAASSRKADAIILFAGVTLGRGARVFVGDEVTSLISKRGNKLETPNVVSYFLIGLVVLLTFSAWWHLNLAGTYHGPRWMGLWNNPNIYGMLMGAGGVLAIGLLAAKQKSEIINFKWIRIFLWVAVFMLGVGLVMSYSRGAWLGAGIGLLYLAWSYGKLKWRFVLPVAAVAAVVVLYLWGSTADSAPWYVKRADLGRPSAQNRATAWRAGLEIMRDHPLGVGWNQAVNIYREKYNPPEGGPGALTTNDYLMLGTELGIPALLCFVVYVGLALKTENRKQKAEASADGADSRRLFSFFSLRKSAKSAEEKAGGEQRHCVCSAVVPPPVATPGGTPGEPADETSALRCACRAGALVLLVAFWFDGGLFNLPTAAVFWVLLELGAARGGRVDSGELMVDSPKAA